MRKYVTEIKELQDIELEILRDIDSFCREKGIEYFIVGGTLLGAIRHKGFIPWDDDVDIAMDERNFHSFIHEDKSQLMSKYSFQSFGDKTDYALPFAKIRKNNTHVVEKFSKNVTGNNGIWIDIFCYDLVPKKIAHSKINNLKLRLLGRINLLKNGYSPSDLSKKRIMRYVNSIIQMLPISKKCARNLFVKALNKRKAKNESDNNTYVERDTQYYGNFVFPYNCIQPLSEIEFCDLKLPCPNDVDQYLKIAYGDYMQFPPIDERHGHMVTEIYTDE